MKNWGVRSAFISLLFIVSVPASADIIGVWGNGEHLSVPITNSGHTFVSVNSNSTLEQLNALDQVWLIRQNGNAALKDYVSGGGTLVTEWTGATWALNVASLITATDSFAFSEQTAVEFTAKGVELGFTKALPNPYFNQDATAYFRSFTGLGDGVDVIATAGGYNVGVVGEYGLGSVMALGWDWQDDRSIRQETQWLVDDITGLSFDVFYARDVSGPGALFFVSMLLMIAGRRKQI